MLTANPASTNPAPCGSGTQLLGIEYANGTEISYSLVANGSGATAVQDLYRNVCNVGGQSSSIVSHDVVNQSTGTGPPSAVISCSVSTAPSCAGTPPAWETSWVSVSQVDNVSLPLTYTSSNYKQTLFAVPSGRINAPGGTTIAAPPYNCRVRDCRHGNLRVDVVLHGLHRVEHAGRYTLRQRSVWRSPTASPIRRSP